MSAQNPARYIHATALVLGEAGVLIRGETASGKSSLADHLMALARCYGYFSALIGDDRVAISRRGAHLIVSGHPQIEGKIERRAEGIGILPTLPGAVVRLVVSLEKDPARWPDSAITSLNGVDLPHLILRDDQDLAARAHRVLVRAFGQ